MKVVRRLSELRHVLGRFRRAGKTIGFVPTMGDFHEGHLSLMRRARRENDIVVVSIFVNPKQFGAGEDFKRYPRNLIRDSKWARSAGIDIVFAPSVAAMYPADFQTSVETPGLSSFLCGRDRPGHFTGVATAVARLFGLVEPQKAYFGLKDYQQAVIIRQMVRDLAMPVEVKLCPLVRDRDGLALSSRNRYLTSGERKKALSIYKALKAGRSLIKSGTRGTALIKRRMRKVLNKSVDRIHYVSLADPETLTEVKKIKRNVLIAIAARVGRTRLIDNMLVKA